MRIPAAMLNTPPQAMKFVSMASLIMGIRTFAKKKKQVKTASWGTATKLMAIPMLPPYIRAMKKSRIALEMICALSPLMLSTMTEYSPNPLAQNTATMVM